MSDASESSIRRLKRFWDESVSPTEGPGYTDYPRADIKAHRANARVIRWVGFLLGLGGFYVGWNGDVAYMFAGIAAFAMSMWAASDFRLQALEWEVQLDDE